MPRPVRRRLQRVVKKSWNINDVLRAQGMRTLHALGGDLSAGGRTGVWLLVPVAATWRKLYERAGWLARHQRVRLLFQPAYHPWDTRIEQLWKQLHDTVARNLCFRTPKKLIAAVRHYMTVCYPFPGSAATLAIAA